MSRSADQLGEEQNKVGRVRPASATIVKSKDVFYPPMDQKVELKHMNRDTRRGQWNAETTPEQDKFQSGHSSAVGYTSRRLKGYNNELMDTRRTTWRNENMSRAANIIAWVQAVDEADPVAFGLDHDPNFHLSNAAGYTYQDRGQKDKQGNVRVMSGTKPSGMMVNNDPAAMGRMNVQMDPQDMQMMDVRP